MSRHPRHDRRRARPYRAPLFLPVLFNRPEQRSIAQTLNASPARLGGEAGPHCPQQTCGAARPRGPSEHPRRRQLSRHRWRQGPSRPSRPAAGRPAAGCRPGCAAAAARGRRDRRRQAARARARAARGASAGAEGGRSGSRGGGMEVVVGGVPLQGQCGKR